jgi:hypothetical protein
MKCSFVGKHIAKRIFARSRTEWKDKSRLALAATSAGPGEVRPLQDSVQWPFFFIGAVQHWREMHNEELHNLYS